MVTKESVDRMSRLAMQLKRSRNWEEGKRLDEIADRLREILAQQERERMRRY